MPEPQRTDGGGAGEESVSSVSLELMAKDCAGRRIQGIRMMHSKPENFINEDGHNPVIAPQIGPNQSPKTSPSTLGRSETYGPGPSQ
ncbi:hypothetical protein O181_129188 [Austropuccinia psidii MF-1]|uniref:Uncharacterized protein n=1 Tax=Austropuccinia psidii MF-1 TaxID=1389203 RepID=A0A9Q3Q8K8_9BASI|nr:hypothetical protein [Austropuccinia psidii MF-1]